MSSCQIELMSHQGLSHRIFTIMCGLTLLYPVDYSILTKWMSPFVNIGVSGIVHLYHFYLVLRKNTHLPYANCTDPDQIQHFAASDLCRCCLPMSC